METAQRLRTGAATKASNSSRTSYNNIPSESSASSRKLQRCGEEGGRTSHCVSPEELDVYSAPVYTPVPSFSPTFTPTMVVTAAAAVVPEKTATIPPSPSPVFALVPTTMAPSFNPTTKEPTTAPTRSPTPAASQEASYTFTFVTKEPSTTNTEVVETTNAPSVSPTDSDTVFPTFESERVTTGDAAPTPSPTVVALSTEQPTEANDDNTDDEGASTATSGAPTQAPNSDRTDEEGNNNAFNFPTIQPTAEMFDDANTVLPTSVNYDDDTNEETDDDEISTEEPSTVSPTISPIFAPTLMAGNNNISPGSGGLSTIVPSSSNSNNPLPTTAPTKRAGAATATTATASPTADETSSSSSTATTNNSLQCKSNSNGNFGVVVGDGTDTTDTPTDGDDDNHPHTVRVDYRYQVETLSIFDTTEEDLNTDILQRIEKVISDLLVESYFPPTSGHVCLTPSPEVASGGASAVVNTATALTGGASTAKSASAVVNSAKALTGETSSKGMSTSVMVNTATALRRGDRNGQRRFLQASTTVGGEIVGLSAQPTDQVMEGGPARVACPYSSAYWAAADIDASGCFVIDGGLSIFAAPNENTEKLSAWVDSVIQVELEKAMDAGKLNDADPSIAFVRYISPGTELTPVDYNSTSTSSGGGGGVGGNSGVDGGGEDFGNATEINGAQKSGSNDTDEITSAPVWSWILGGFGFIGLAIVAIMGVAAYKRRNRDEQVGTIDSPTKSLASRRRLSPMKRRSSPAKRTMGAFPVNRMEIVDDNSELDAEIYQDDDDDDDGSNRNEPGQADTTSGIPAPISWRKVPEPHSGENEEYSRLEINATDPNQPVVRPVLDEESETYISNVV